MRRWLAGAVAVEMILGGLAVAALSNGAPGGAGAPGSARPAALTGTLAAPAAQESTTGWGIEDSRRLDGSAPGVRRRGPNFRSTATPRTAAHDFLGFAASAERAGERAKGISFESPKDFATGATPSSTEFNKKYGEQTPFMANHLTFSDSVVTGDFNGDGRADVVQTNVLAGSISIFLGDGLGRFAAPALQSVGIYPNFAVADDLDGDGKLDLAIADTGANGVYILRGDGKGAFAESRFLSVPTPRNVAVGRIDGDGIADLAVASAGPVCPRLVAPCDDAPSEGGVHAFVGLGDGAFRQAQFLPFTHSSDSRPVGANFVVLRDFDGDGLGDLAVTVGTANVAFDRAERMAKPIGDDVLVYLNGGGVVPFGALPDQPPIRVGGTPDAIAVGDWDGDTNPDLATLEYTSGSITSLLGDERGHFRVRATDRSVGAIPRSLTVGDFDGDGIADLVTANFAASTISVLEGEGDGTFHPAVDYWIGNAPTSAAVGDFDGDRRLDVVVGRLRTDQLSLLTNDGPRHGDGVVIHRDIPYGSPTHPPNDDPFPIKHTLDVYVPPPGTAPFAGSSRGYPVVFFAHGGARVTNKSYASYLLRRLSAQGFVAVSTNYRLGTPQTPEQVQDVAQAFRWTRDNIDSAAYGGDPRNMSAFGQSWGAGLLIRMATDPQWPAEQQHIRALVLVGCEDPGAAARIPESLVLSGDEGLEDGRSCQSYADKSNERGTRSTHVRVSGRDHFTLFANLALADDPGRIAIDAFLREQMGRGQASGGR